jgi:Arc/MetJ family transcription regulator
MDIEMHRLDGCILKDHTLYIQGFTMAGTATSLRLDTRLADKAAKVLGVKTRTEAIHIALREIVALEDFKKYMKENQGKGTFAGYDEDE